MELLVPYPFSLWIIYDEAYVKQRELEMAERERQLKAERERLEHLQWLESQISSTERNELEERELLGRQWLEELRDTSSEVLPILYTDFLEVLKLQVQRAFPRGKPG